MKSTPGWWERLTLSAETMANLRSRAAARNVTEFDLEFASFWECAAAPEAWARFSSYSGELAFIYFACPLTQSVLKVDASLFHAEGVALKFRAAGRDWALGWSAV